MIGLRVVIASSDNRMVNEIKETLTVNGSLVVGKAGDGVTALKVIRTTQPDFIIMDGEINFLEAAKTVDEYALAPMLLITSPNRWEILSEIEKWGFDSLDKPVKPEILKLKITVGLERFRKCRETVRENELLHSQKTTRNLVERAKGLLVEYLGLSEIQAMSRLQILGRDEGLSIRDMAEKILKNRHHLNISA